MNKKELKKVQQLMLAGRTAEANALITSLMQGTSTTAPRAKGAAPVIKGPMTLAEAKAKAAEWSLPTLSDTEGLALLQLAVDKADAMVEDQPTNPEAKTAQANASKYLTAAKKALKGGNKDEFTLAVILRQLKNARNKERNSAYDQRQEDKKSGKPQQKSAAPVRVADDLEEAKDVQKAQAYDEEAETMEKAALANDKLMAKLKITTRPPRKNKKANN